MSVVPGLKDKILGILKPTYEIDGANFTTLEGFYDEIERVLIPSKAWGRNLDAFNDILRGGFKTPDNGFVLRWRNSDQSRARLGFAETVRQLEQRLSAAHKSNRSSIEHEIKQAKSEHGSTVFDWLVKLIKEHGASGEESSDRVELILD